MVAEGAAVILGPLFNQAVTAVTPVAGQHDIRVLAFSNVTAAAADGTFLLGFRPEEQVERVVRYALEHVQRRAPDAGLPGAAAPPAQAAPGLTAQGPTAQASRSRSGRAEPAPLDAGPVRIAGLAPNDAYGATALDVLRRTVVADGGELGQTLFYPPDQADPSGVVRQIAAYDARKAALDRERARLQKLNDDQSKQALQRLSTLDTLGGPPFDAILIADGGDRLRSVASLLTFFDVDQPAIRFLGTMRWQDDPRVLQEAALQQGWFAASAPEGLAQFKSRFQGVYGHPPQLLAALAYDATALAVIVARDMHDPKFQTATPDQRPGLRRRDRAVPAAPGRPRRAWPRHPRGRERHGADHRAPACELHRPGGRALTRAPAGGPKQRAIRRRSARPRWLCACLAERGSSAKVWLEPCGWNIGS